MLTESTDHPQNSFEGQQFGPGQSPAPSDSTTIPLKDSPDELLGAPTNSVANYMRRRNLCAVCTECTSPCAAKASSNFLKRLSRLTRK
jgi:hypothetical protein